MEGEVKKMYKTRIKTTLFVGLVVLASFIGTGISGAAMAGSEDARAGDSATGKWQTLFDGKLLNTFRGWRSEDMPKGWHVVDATLSKEGNVEDLVTREPFRDFELELEWSIGKAGNSGVFYRGTREYDEIYWSAPEYQLLDDANAPDGRNPLTSAASAYGLYAAPAGVVKPFGEWNKTRILVKGNHVEHWLNDQKVVEYDLGSPEWKAKVAASKFSKYPNYGLAKAGVIGIQGDHPGSLALRHIRIRELP
ncbi:MAG: hypothetical protein JWN58_2469 [Gammaproteobacteria bacterium]|jgi:hypothetical protein|nr:hypothetical protein [Gammaproteobacteria bacterium]